MTRGVTAPSPTIVINAWDLASDSVTLTPKADVVCIKEVVDKCRTGAAMAAAIKATLAAADRLQSAATGRFIIVASLTAMFAHRLYLERAFSGLR